MVPTLPSSPPPHSAIIFSPIECWALGVTFDSRHYLSTYPARDPALRLCSGTASRNLTSAPPSLTSAPPKPTRCPPCFKHPWSSSAVPFTRPWDCYVSVSLAILPNGKKIPQKAAPVSGTFCVLHGTWQKVSLIKAWESMNFLSVTGIVIRSKFYFITRTCLSILKWNGLWNSKLSNKELG